MNTLYLIARIADETIALPAEQIGSVVEVEDIAPIPRVPPHVAGLFALRSRVLTVIDTRAALNLGSIARAGAMTAVIVESEGHSYALLVDMVEDVIEAAAPEPCPALLGAAWRRAARGTIRRDEQAILLVDPAVLVAGPDALAA
ncbi:chemotaxis protein CheW [uncultured Sphingomonas sp.]|uniref:chemotaxis protein CheW n=1 Tax=uncultured Sphingomonas sp. TaxID=158754 RepID=UPI0025E9913D|nr:chemotaxis protein CheW [uncultured Sphingomonas sp.]